MRIPAAVHYKAARTNPMPPLNHCRRRWLTSIQHRAVNRVGWVAVQYMVAPVIEQPSRYIQPILAHL